MNEPDIYGTVRLGTPEDFATRHLPGVLARFTQAYPAVALEVTCDLTLNLIERFRKGAFDLMLIKQERAAAEPGGIRVWGEPFGLGYVQTRFLVRRTAVASGGLAQTMLVPEACHRGIGQGALLLAYCLYVRLACRINRGGEGRTRHTVLSKHMVPSFQRVA